MGLLASRFSTARAAAPPAPTVEAARARIGRLQGDGRGNAPPRRHVVLEEANLAAPLTAGGRLILVGDVHGCADELDLLLAKCGFKHGTDTVVLLGDLVNKGPKSIATLQRARQLGALGVRGNHDDKAIAIATGETTAFGAHWLWLADLEQADLDYLMGLPYTLSLPWLDAGVLLVHAGVVPDRPLEEQDTTEMTHMRNCVRDAPGGPWRALADLGQGDAWAKAYEGPPHVYFGHDARRRLQQEASATGLDTGCVYGGALSAVVLPGGELIQVDALHEYSVPPGQRGK